MKYLIITALFAFCAFCPAQFKVELKGGSGEAYEYLNKPFPDGMKVYNLDRTVHVLKTEQVTLVQVFGLCCGAEPDVWFKVRELEQTYKDQGLKTIAISFENGAGLKEHQKNILEFFEKVEKPEHFYMDHLGYVIEDMGVPGFPTYFLVDAKGVIVLRVNGKDAGALTVLEREIKHQLLK